MGAAELDANVRNNVEMLEGRRFPASSFRLESIESQASALQPGQESKVTLHGRLELKGVTVPLRAAGSMELQEAAGEGRALHLRARFVIEQLRERFAIAGPGGENEPAGNRVSVEVNAHLRP